MFIAINSLTNTSESSIDPNYSEDFYREERWIANPLYIEDCPKCNGIISIKRGQYGKFYGCSNYPGYRFTIRINDD